MPSSWKSVLAVTGVLAATALVGVPAVVGTAAASSTGASLEVAVAPQAAVGGALSVSLVLHPGTSPVAGFQAALRYDTSRVQYAGATTAQSRLSAAGTSLHALTPVENGTGVVLGGWSCTSAACLAADGSTAPRVVTLATAVVYPTRAGALPLALDDVRLVGPDGASLPVTLPSAPTVVRVGVHGTAAHLPGQVATAGHAAPRPAALPDVSDVARSWSDAQATGRPCGPSVDAASDVNGDGCLDVRDVQAAALRGAPAPAVTPAPEVVTPGLTASRQGTIAVLKAGTTPPVATFTVTTDVDSATGTCTATSCTLRAAILAANAVGKQANAPGSALIQFAVPGAQVHVIQLVQKLPNLTNPYGITVDGRTQAGWSATTDLHAFNGVNAIVLVGQGYEATATTTSNYDGFFVQTSNNTFYGLTMYNFRKEIVIDGSSGAYNGVFGSILCSDGAGNNASNHVVTVANGVVIGNGAHDNVVGAAGPANRNVLSGCAHHGLVINGPATNNVAKNNIFGLSPDGTRAVPNQSHGTDINYGATDNVIGGTAAGEGNVSSGNGGEAMEISHNPYNQRNKLIGNFIGTSLDGLTAPVYAQNDQHGVSLEGAPSCDTGCPDDAGYSEVAYNVIAKSDGGGIIIDKARHNDWVHDNKIGMTANGTPSGNPYFGVRMEHLTHNTLIANNEIAYNDTGIQVTPLASRTTDKTTELATDFNTFSRNSIHDNVGFGIDLFPFGKINTAATADPLANSGVAVPTLTEQGASAVGVTACASCLVEVFQSDGAAGGTGEGRYYITNGTTDSNGAASIALPQGSQGKVITATATTPAGDTSEFSNTVTVGSATNLPPTARAAAPVCSALTCSFDGSSSSDPEGGSLSYTWNFGDGSPTATGATVSHTYASAGSYSATLTVTDPLGATGTTTVTATPTAPAGHAPVAALATPVCSGLSCTYDASGSTDADGDALTYAWTFGDGATATGVTTSHAYSAAGTYTVTVTATDPGGLSSSASQTVTVSVPNQPPTAVIGSSICDTLTCSFSGAGSSDPEGAALTYAWTFGDGTTGSGPSTTHTYAAAGTYTVTLTVTDPGGLTSSASVNQAALAASTTPVATDTFTRTTTGGWGTADTGGAWTAVGTASTLTTTGTTGTVKLTNNGVTTGAALKAVSQRDVDLTATVSTDKLAAGTPEVAYLAGRRVTGASEYRAKVRLLADKTVRLSVTRKPTGAEVVLGDEVIVPGLTNAAGKQYRVRFQVSGFPATLRARVWAVGTAEPTTWAVTRTDSDPSMNAAGSVALYGLLGTAATNSPVTFTFDDLTVRRLS